MLKIYKEIEINKDNIYRYIQSEKTEEISLLIDKCLEECKDILSFKVAYEQFEISINEDSIKFPFASIKSSDLSKFLNDKKNVVVFVATIGLEFDKLILKYSKLSPSKAIVFQGIGIEYIESLCDRFNLDISENKKRFSPGYGDLDLSFQKDIFSVINTKEIGVSLNDSLLMSPSKSVSAIIGV